MVDRCFEISTEKGHFHLFEKKGRGSDPQDPPLVVALLPPQLSMLPLRMKPKLSETFVFKNKNESNSKAIRGLKNPTSRAGTKVLLLIEKKCDN